MTRSISLFLVVLVVFGPINVMATEVAAGKAERPRPSFESIAMTTAPDAPVAGYGSFRTGPNPGDIVGTVATADRTVEMRVVRGNRVVTGDNYSLQIKVVENDENAALVKLVAKSPAGQVKTGTILMNKKTGTLEKAGMDGVRELLNASADFGVLSSVLPSMTPAGRPGLVETASCLVSGLNLVAAVFAMAACETILGCVGAFLWFLSAWGGFIEDGCLSGSDGPVDEPPCTSYTIC